MINNEIGPKALDGTAGGTITVNPGFKSMQIGIAGRTTGKIIVTAKSKGGHAAEPFEPPLIINLASGEYTVFPIGALESITLTPDVAGDDFNVTILQWPIG